MQLLGDTKQKKTNYRMILHKKLTKGRIKSEQRENF